MRSFPFLRTVRAQMTFWNVFVLTVVLMILGGVLRVSLEHNLMSAVDRSLGNHARRGQSFWGRMSESNPQWRPPQPSGMNPRWPGGGGRDDSRTPSRWQSQVVEKQYDLQGRRILSFSQEPPLDRYALTLAGTGQTVNSTVRIEDQEVRVVSAPLRRRGQIWGVIQVGYSLNDMELALDHLNTILLALIPAALAAAGMGGLFLTGRLLRPVREVTSAAERIGAEDLSQRLPVSGQDELSRLVTTFNSMLARLEQSFEQQRRFTADASHELRTPLTVVKANTSLALFRNDLSDTQRTALQSIDHAADVMNHVVQDLLLLARSDAGQLSLQLHPTRLSEVLETAVEYVEPQRRAALHNLVTDPALVVCADSGHLTRLFINLLDNAVRHTPENGVITLSVQAEETTVVISVEDTGCGIPPEHLPHICERFYRVDTDRSRARGGTGLGLAICQSIVRSHGGSFTISSTLEVGTTVRVSLPRLTPPPEDV